MSKLQKVQAFLNTLAAIRESWLDRKQEVPDVCDQVVDQFPEIILGRQGADGYNVLFKSVHNALSNELRFLTTYPALVPSGERKVPVGGLPVGHRFFHQNTLCAVSLHSDSNVVCSYVSNGRTFKMSPGVTVEPAAVDVDKKADWLYLGFLSLGDRFLLDGFVYEVVDRGPVFSCRRVFDKSGTLAFFAWDTKVLRYSPGGQDNPVCSYPVDPADFILSSKSAEVELRTLVPGAKFELGGIEFKVVDALSVATIDCQYKSVHGNYRELPLPSHLKVTPK